MQPDTPYHIYNHANGSENLFRSDENYRYFLRQWAKHIEPVAATYAYCLMPNHIHFLVQIRSEADIESTFGKFKTFQKLEYRISKQFANLFSGYTQAFNKMYGRRGSLFVPNFKKKEIESDEYLTETIIYIHANPVRHGFVKQLTGWPYSSYHAYLSDQPTLLAREAVLDWFGGQKRLIEAHENIRSNE